MAIDTNDKKWSIIYTAIGAPSLGGSLGGGAPIESTEDQWVFVGRYWGIVPDGPVAPTQVPTYASIRSRTFTWVRGP
jgi:hypothetical protein